MTWWFCGHYSKCQGQNQQPRIMDVSAQQREVAEQDSASALDSSAQVFLEHQPRFKAQQKGIFPNICR